MCLNFVASLSDWADAGGLFSVAIALVGVVLVVVQLQGSQAATRAQATIQFQQAFRESAGARARLLGTFPVHVDVLARLGPSLDHAQWDSWSTEEELDGSHKADAVAVVNALNDVAQYVADGLSLRSALQQYHTIFIRVGVLLLPYIDKRNEDGAARWGRRIPLLYNVALDYHRLHSKHRGSRIFLRRKAVNGTEQVELSLCGDTPEASRHAGFADDPRSRRRRRHTTLGGALRAAERELRR